MLANASSQQKTPWRDPTDPKGDFSHTEGWRCQKLETYYKMAHQRDPTILAYRVANL